MRPTSRQRMQRLADELAPRGWSNYRQPKTRRSKVVQLTRKGDEALPRAERRFPVIASTMGRLLQSGYRKHQDRAAADDDVNARSERRS